MSQTNADDRLSDAIAQRDLLFTTLADVLGNFHEKGYPGRPCIRTGWVREETYAQWHGVLAGIVAADGEVQP